MAYFTPQTATVTLETAGTELPFFSTETPAHAVVIQALPANAGVVYIGVAGASSTAYGVSLAAGMSLTLSCDGNDRKLNLADFYIDAANNDEAVTVLWF